MRPLALDWCRSLLLANYYVQIILDEVLVAIRAYLWDNLLQYSARKAIPQ